MQRKKASPSKLQFGSVFIPCLCLVIAVVILFGKNFTSRDMAPLTHPITSNTPPAHGTITIHYLERPPYYITGSLGVYGLCADPAKLALTKAGVQFRWQKTPAKRQMAIIKANRSEDCLLGWFKNSEREKFANFSACIYQDKPLMALARADNKKMISGKTLEETLANTSLILLRKNGYSYGRFVDAKIRELHSKQEVTNTGNVGMFKMIHAKRADYFFISEEEAEILIATSGLPKTDFKYIRFSNMPAGNKRYLLFSKKVENEVIEKINAAIRKFIHNEPRR